MVVPKKNSKCTLCRTNIYMTCDLYSLQHLFEPFFKLFSAIKEPLGMLIKYTFPLAKKLKCRLFSSFCYSKCVEQDLYKTIIKFVVDQYLTMEILNRNINLHRLHILIPDYSIKFIVLMMYKVRPTKNLPPRFLSYNAKKTAKMLNNVRNHFELLMPLLLCGDRRCPFLQTSNKLKKLVNVLIMQTFITLNPNF